METTQHLQAQPRSWEASNALRLAIRRTEPFVTGGALRGEKVHGLRHIDTGELPAEHVDRLSLDAQYVDYVVWSYGTPIAWHRTDGAWRIPDVGYSRTTSRHQTHCRVAAEDYCETP